MIYLEKEILEMRLFGAIRLEELANDTLQESMIYCCSILKGQNIPLMFNTTNLGSERDTITATNTQKYFEEKEGKWYHLAICRDVWDDIYVIGTGNRQRLNYPTQKPEALLKRIIEASSNKDDAVLSELMKWINPLLP